MQKLVALLSGLLFGLGLSVSRMIDPAKVVGFLDIFGDWDPSLAFVMGGALLVSMPATQIILKRRQKPVLDKEFYVPTNKKIDKNLAVGAVLFGAGWGIAGLCPGPALASLSFASGGLLIFIAAYLAGTYVGKGIQKLQVTKAQQRLLNS
ncbi:YeeE/YedE family protein [Salinibius halmophilus]|uniref:YeeE/YedE family protein n=1 Tax=Salinibius halmophilus TaxID=1853216 RepID=UPI000E6693CF|nr:YeeE/YedE family protein [Salinibius halmophilus]